MGVIFPMQMSIDGMGRESVGVLIAINDDAGIDDRGE
jgi:hypothetical protein